MYVILYYKVVGDMRKIKQYRKWAICQLNEREVEHYGFSYAVIHPDNV